jgi:Fasciclin domain
MVIPTLGVPIKITSDDGDIVLNDESMVVSRDLIASNGVIHGIDTVLGSKDVGNVEECSDGYRDEDWYQILF